MLTTIYMNEKLLKIYLNVRLWASRHPIITFYACFLALMIPFGIADTPKTNAEDSINAPPKLYESNSVEAKPVDAPAIRALACRSAQKFISSRLIAPRTAIFESCITPTGYKEHVFWTNVDGTLTVSGHVDSQNIYGATIRQTWTATLRIDDENPIGFKATVLSHMIY